MSSEGRKLFNDGEKRGNEVRGEEAGVRSVGGINPSEKEVMVTIWHTFDSLEPFISSGGVELSSGFSGQGEPSDLEVSVVSPLDPIGEGVHLETFSWPVPGSLGFSDVQFTIDPESHGRVTSMRTSTPFDDLIKTIKSGDGEEISRVNQVVVKFDDNIRVGSLFPLVTCGILDESDVFMDLEFGWLGSKEGEFGVKTKSTKEEENSLEEIGDFVDELVAKTEDEYSIIVDGLHFSRREVSEGDLVDTRSEDDFVVEIADSGEDKTVSADTVMAVRVVVDDSDGIIVNDVERHGVLIETRRAEASSGVSRVELSNVGGEEFKEAGIF